MRSPARPLVFALAVAALLAARELGGAAAASAADNDIAFSPGMQQGLFRDFAAELGLGIAAYQARPAEALGFGVWPGLDVGVEVTAVNINDDRLYWQLALQGNDPPSYLPVPKAHLTVGLPLGLDLGALYSAVPSSNIRLWGAEAKWALLRGNVALPAIAVRGSFTSLEGVDELDMTTRALDASISKGVGPLTPYVGAGRVWIVAEPKGTAAAPPPSGLGLAEVHPAEDRLFAGFRLSLAFLSLVAEGSWSRVPAYTLRLNLSF
ncbi:MAG TPA: hypothetical protein VNM66_01900 [Thermodesulfobacteriota bacterium]|nr:hypothetical protein [Thermodesulfobacteriota bacterium]